MFIWPEPQLKPLYDVHPGSIVLHSDNRIALAFGQKKAGIDDVATSHLIDLMTFNVVSAETYENNGGLNVGDFGRNFSLFPDLNGYRVSTAPSTAPGLGDLFQDQHNRFWLVAEYHGKLELYGLHGESNNQRRELARISEPTGLVFGSWSIAISNPQGNRLIKRIQAGSQHAWVRADL